MGNAAEWGAPAGLAVAPAQTSEPPRPRREPCSVASHNPSQAERLIGTVSAVAPIAPGLYRVLIDYQRLYERHRTNNHDDPIRAGMTAVLFSHERLSFVIHKAAAGYAVAHVAAVDLAAKLKPH
jgi:hypothetical protein